MRDEQANNAKMEQLQRELRRARQPLNEFYVTFRLDLPTQHIKLRDFDSAIRGTIDTAINGNPMPQDVYVSQRAPNGEILRLGISPTSALFPDIRQAPLPHFLLNYPGIELHFYSADNRDFSDRSKSDLMVPVLAVVNRSFSSSQLSDNPSSSGTIGIDVTNRQVFAEVYDWRVPSRQCNGQAMAEFNRCPTFSSLRSSFGIVDMPKVISQQS
jgi:hypothetical protein